MMPAVLSKAVERVPWELLAGKTRSTQCGAKKMTIPVSELHQTCRLDVSTEKMLRGPFNDYIQDKGVPLEHVRAAALLVDHCIPSTTKTPSGEQRRLYPEGEEKVWKCWVQEEECKGFFNILARHAKELKEVIDPFDGCNTEVPMALFGDVERLLKAFICEVETRRKAQQITRELWCWHCRSQTNPGQLCGACKTARYCDESCQRMDWIAHRLVCSGRQ